jgi:hypothetical protein
MKKETQYVLRSNLQKEIQVLMLSHQKKYWRQIFKKKILVTWLEQLGDENCNPKLSNENYGC